jgi:hypothetical protein
MDFAGRIERTDLVAVLGEVVDEMAAAYGEPVPEACWYETAHEYLETKPEYSKLLAKAAARFETIIEFDCNRPKLAEQYDYNGDNVVIGTQPWAETYSDNRGESYD